MQSKAVRSGRDAGGVGWVPSDPARAGAAGLRSPRWRLLPAADRELFLDADVRREALLSSQIEGTQSSLPELLLFELEEAAGVPFGDLA
jgi:hypothetical protein